jgi:hypothetical protein
MLDGSISMPSLFLISVFKNKMRRSSFKDALIYGQGLIKGQASRAAAQGANLKGAINVTGINRKYVDLFKC